MALLAASPYWSAVTPLAGVWIEIWHLSESRIRLHLVTPLAGVWIEIEQYNECVTVRCRHSPCGSVD